MRELRLQRKREIDAIIAEDAEQETLYDQPLEERGVVRVSGPFTVEAIPPAVLDLQAPSPIGGDPEPQPVEASIGPDDAGRDSASDSETAVIARLIELMRQDGVTFPGGRKLAFSDLRAVSAGVLHAEGEPADDATLARVAVSFGPQHGAVSARQVEDGIRAAHLSGYDAVIFAGFAFQAEAQQAISGIAHPRVKAFMSHIRPDVIMTDARGESLLKTTASAQLFSVFGEPDVELLPGDDGDGLFRVRLNGVDVYDPLTGEVASARAEQVAAWFLDTDYDGRAFAICQAFFPDRKAWEKIERALKGTLDPERFEQLTQRVSLPFRAGEHRRVAAKVIDQRGNEVMRVLDLAPGATEDGRYTYA